MKRTVIAAAALAALCACAPEYSEGDVRYSIWYDYEGTAVPDTDTLGTPAVTGEQPMFKIEGEAFEADHFAASFVSELSVDRSGDWYFLIKADDRARLSIDGKTVIDLDVADSKNGTGEATLKAGSHSVRIDFFENKGRQSLKFLLGRKGELAHVYNGDGPVTDTSFVAAQSKEAFARYRLWKGDDETVVFPILTDIHSEERYTYQHIGFIASTSALFGFDFMACLGDIGLNLGLSHYSKEYSQNMIRTTLDEMKKYDGVFLYAPGNHDWDAGEGEFLSEQFLSETFQKPWEEKAGGNLHLTPGRTWAWYDVPGRNVRVILLNSEGTGTQGEAYYIYGDEQMEWFEGVLEATDPGTAIVVMSHYMPHPMGRWSNEPAPLTKESNERMMNTLAEWKTRRNIVGLFCGDSHVNVLVERDGVDYYITQSYGWASDRMMEGQKHAFYDYRKNLCCDIIAIKPAQKEVRSFRMGAGGEDYDYEFTY